MIFEIKFLIALIFTIAIETLVLIGITRFLFKINKTQLSTRFLILTGFLCSAATLPYVWFFFPAFIASYSFYVLVSEVFAVLAETVILYAILKLTMKRCFILSFLCNMASFLFGMIFLK